MLDRGVPPTEIERLFVIQAYGYSFVDDRLAPAAAWLALARPDIRLTVRRVQPKVLIQHGDPASLPEQERLEILREFLNELASGEPSRESITYEALDRFTTPNFSAAINLLVDEYASCADALILLMRVCQHSKLLQSSKAVMKIAMSTSPANLYAINALGSIGSTEQLLELAEHTLASPEVGYVDLCRVRAGGGMSRCFNNTKWVSLSFPQFGEIGGYPGCDDGVVGGRSDGHRLLDEAVEQEASGL